VLIASNVVALAVISSDGAKYSIKLFDTTKPELDQFVLTPGTVIEKLNRANVYLAIPHNLVN
jgi:hypothetical protein